MNIGNIQYQSAPPIVLANGMEVPEYRDPADPCGYGLTLYGGACIPDDSPSLAQQGDSRIVDWSILPQINWGLIAALVLAGYVVLKKVKGA